MIIEYIVFGVISSVLLIALGWQTWRKRVWKKRSLAQMPGFFQTMKYAASKGVRNAVESEWPELLDKEKPLK